MGINRIDDGDALAMECDWCGARAPFDDGLPWVKQMAAYATDHGCSDARRAAPTGATP